MTRSLFLSLREGATLVPVGDAELAVQTAAGRVTLKRLTPGVRDALQHLGTTAAEEDRLDEVVVERDGTDGLAMLHYHLQQLSRRCLLWHSADDGRNRLATLVPTSPYFAYPGQGIDSSRLYGLSRFAFTRAEGGLTLLESPLAHARVVLHDWRAAALVHVLSQPRRVADAAGSIPGLSSDAAATVMDLLLNAVMLGEVEESGIPATDRPLVLQSWEFHDLLFHTRSREGRHDQPVGGTYRFVGKFDPQPALTPAPSGESVELTRPDLARLEREDPPFAQVQERRRSVREYGEKPITAVQLGEFLYRSARVKGSSEMDVDTPAGPVRMVVAPRPYPGGGALYEMEFYVAVNTCDGLTPGLYHYDPALHRLGRLAGQTTEVAQLLSAASEASAIPAENLQILLIFSARFQRVAWKYAAMAYALILKHVGVLCQTMYLAATAMNLAPCALGCGNADLFARAAGTDYYAESSVGEFLLGSLP